MVPSRNSTGVGQTGSTDWEVNFAYVRFVDDKYLAYVPIEDVKHFAPTSTDDYDKKKTYKVKWNDTSSKDASGRDKQDCYYKANILCLGCKYITYNILFIIVIINYLYIYIY